MDDSTENYIKDLEEKVDKIAEEVEEVHTILVRQRNFKRVKTVIIILIFLTSLWYMHNLYRTYGPKAIGAYEGFLNITSEAEEVLDSAQNFKSTIHSVRSALGAL